MDSHKTNHRSAVATLATVVFCVFLVSGIVVAATTIGSSLSTDGNLIVLGNAGIGTSTPSARFSVTGDGTGATRAFVFADANNTERFTLLNNGNVGVGTTSPVKLFSVSGASALGGAVSVGSAYAGLTQPSNGLIVQGSVGIGTTSPLDTFEIGGRSVAINTSRDGSLGSWSTNASTLPQTRYWASTVVANGYIYLIGGYNASAQSTVYYAKLNGDGSTGAWPTNPNALPAVRYKHSPVVANGFMYVIGGLDSSAAQSTLYYAKLNADGSIGTWTTNASALPVIRANHTSVVANGYIYVIAGENNGGGASPQTTVYYAKINADGSTGSWSTNANTLPQGRSAHASVAANGYVYVIGGYFGGGKSTVYYAKLNPDGSIGAWSTNTNALPAGRFYVSAVVANNYVYVIGGDDNANTSNSTIYYARLNADGSVGSWSTNANALPIGQYGDANVVANGYVYVLGGYNASMNTVSSAVYYSSTARTRIAGALDLLGLKVGR